MILDYSDIVKVENKNFQYWDDAAQFCVDKIFNFSDGMGNNHLSYSVSFIINHLKDNPYLIDYNFSTSDELSLLKDIINFYIDSKIWMYDPPSLRGTSPTTTVEDAVDIHQSFFLLVANCAISLYYKNTNDLFNRENITETIIRKQNDYGPNNISKFGIWGLIVRIHDKIARIDNLLSKKRNSINAVSDETVYDTMLDIIGYSSVMLLWLNGWFLLPMRRDSV